MNDDFKKKISGLRKLNPRYEADAYTFLMECFRLASNKKGALSDSNLKARDICEAVKTAALDSFGPMAITVLNEWGVKSTADIGQLIRGLVDAKILGKEKDDSYTDFEGVFDFHDAFEKPYEPE